MNRLELLKKSFLVTSSTFSADALANFIIDYVNNPTMACIENVTDINGKVRRCLKMGNGNVYAPAYDFSIFFKPQPGKYLHMYYEALNKRTDTTSSSFSWKNVALKTGALRNLYPNTGKYSETNTFSPIHYWSYNAIAGEMSTYQATLKDEYTYIDIDSFKMWVDDSELL